MDSKILLQGFITAKTANWDECKRKECPFISVCESAHMQGKTIKGTRYKLNENDHSCIYPQEQVFYDKEDYKVVEPDFLALASNATGNSFITNLLVHIRGTSTPSLALTYIAFTTHYDDVSGATTISGDNREIGRKAVTNAGSDPTATSTAAFTTSDANTYSTTISGTPASKTTFDITSATGFAVNDRVEVTLSSGAEQTKITGLSSNTVTISPALSAIPSNGNAFKQMISRAYVVTGGSSSAHSGTVAGVARYIRLKTSLQSINFIWTMRLKTT